MAWLVALACAFSLAGDPPAQPPPRASRPLRSTSSPLSRRWCRRDRQGRAIGRGDPPAQGRQPRRRPWRSAARQRPQPALRLRTLPRARFLANDSTDVISFDFGSGVVVGDEGQILTAYHVVQGRGRAGGPRGRPPGVRGRDHRRRPAQRPGRDRAGRRSRGCPPPQLKPIAAGRCQPAPQGIVPDRPGQPVQRGPGRQALGELGHPLERRPPGRARARRDRPSSRAADASPIIPPCFSSTPSSTWG